MSRRESCVWHPMPDEVRRSSVQSRRASLAAGRRKQMQDEPDWEVEAPPTPPPNDYSPRQEAAAAEEREAAAAAAAVAAEEPAVAAAAIAAEQQQEASAAESREPVEEARHEPVEEKSAAEAAEERAVAPEAEEEADVEESVAVDKKRAKTRHTIRFRGDKWAAVTDEAARRQAFEEDVAEAAALSADDIRKLHFEVKQDMMVATFYVEHDAADHEQTRGLHQKFLNCAFEHVCALYPAA